MKQHFLPVTLVLISLLTVANACYRPSSRLEHALQESGSNRRELEKVLDHYATRPGDSLKREAARFLIENMPGHHALDGPFLRDFKQLLDTTMHHYLLKKIVLMQPARFPHVRQVLKIEPDVECIRGDYLIHHIDRTFHLWETLPWLESLSFEDFREYLLPYRVDTETLDYWMDSTDIAREARMQEAACYFDDQKYSTYNMGQPVLDNPFRVNVNDNTVAGIPYTTRECVFSSRAQLVALRTAGIPATIDLVPCWADMNGFHQWTVIIDPKNKDIASQQVETKNAPKVFRRTYSRNDIPRPAKDERVPPFFTDPFYRDVTGKYQQTSEVTVQRETASTGKIHHAYLAIFNQRSLHAVSWSTVRHDEATFREMGRDIVYFPIYLDGEESKSFAYPFLLGANGNVHRLQPDEQHRCTMTLTRKYPLHGQKTLHGKLLRGARFKCSNDRRFRSFILVHEVDRNPNMFPVIVPIDTTVAYRYGLFDHQQSVELAEWEFTDARGKRVPGMIIDPTRRGTNLDLIFDGNALSHGRIDRQLIVDFGKPVHLSRMMYLPRNDANGIYPGNEYELFYHDREGWRSLGCKIATGYSLTFDGVPTNAIYWLRNHTTGAEERVFTWQNGQQRFW